MKSGLVILVGAAALVIFCCCALELEDTTPGHRGGENARPFIYVAPLKISSILQSYHLPHHSLRVSVVYMTEEAESPPTRYHNLTGQVFGRLSVLSYEGKRGHDSMWLCRCSCGKEKLIRYSGLTRGSTTSCGCYRAEVHAKRRERPEGHQRTNKNPLCRIYYSMLTRCYNERNTSYRKYGAKGIEVCQRWRDSFDAFVDDMGPYPAGTRLARLNPSIDFTPDNCFWRNPPIP